MSASDKAIKERHEAGDKSSKEEHKDGSHLEHARREIEKEQVHGPAPADKRLSFANMQPNVIEGGQLILRSPYPHSSESSSAATLGLHLRDQQANEPIASKQTFVVSQDGKILNSERQPLQNLDFSAGVPNDINFLFDRPANFAALSPDQQKLMKSTQKQALSAFIQDIERKVKETQPAAALNEAKRVQAGETGSSNPPAEKKETERPQAEKLAQGDMSEPKAPADRAPSSAESRHAIHGINHAMPNRHNGHMSERQVNRHLPGYHKREHAPNEQEQDRTSPETAAKHLREDQVSAQKNMLAETFAPDKKDPYHTDRTQSDHSHAVGRYGINFHHMNRVLSHALPKEVLEKLGHPPDYSKLGDILKELGKDDPELMKKIQANMQEAVKNGDVPASMTDKFNSSESLSALGQFTDKLRGAKGDISKEEIDKNLPQQEQDAIAQQEVERGMKAGATPGEIALAHSLGKDSTELSSQDRADNKDLMDGAGKFYALGMAKERMDNSETFHWSSTGDGQTMALIAQRMADKINTTGDCAKGPRLTFDALGFHLPKVVATQQGRMLEESGLFKEVTNPRPGDYGYRHWNAQVTAAHAGVDKGDAFTVVGKNKAGQLIGANDHHFVVPPDGGRYRGLKFLRPTAEFYRLYGPDKGSSS